MKTECTTTRCKITRRIKNKIKLAISVLLVVCLIFFFSSFQKIILDYQQRQEIEKKTEVKVIAIVNDLQECFYIKNYSPMIDDKCLSLLNSLQTNIDKLPRSNAAIFLKLWSITQNYLDAKYYESTDCVLKKVIKNKDIKVESEYLTKNELLNNLRYAYQTNLKQLLKS